jgi:hypothetical protein
MTYATQLGRYTKVGRQVTVTGSIVLTAKGSSTGTAEIEGLPFAPLNDGNPTSCAIGFASGLAGIAGAALGLVQSASGKIGLYQSANGAAAPLSHSYFTDTANLNFTATYDAP